MDFLRLGEFFRVVGANGRGGGGTRARVAYEPWMGGGNGNGNGDAMMKAARGSASVPRGSGAFSHWQWKGRHELRRKH